MSDHDAHSNPVPPTGEGGRPDLDAAAVKSTLSSMHRLDLATVAAGLVALVASLLPYYTVSVKGFGGSSANAWHGFLGWFGVVCAVVAAALLVVKALGIMPPLPVPVRTVVLALFGLATLCTLLALFVVPGGRCADGMIFGDSVCDMIDQGHGFGYWLALLSVGAGTALAAMRRGAE